MYDLIIIGGGPAGIVAGIYGGRYGLKSLIVSDFMGGEIALSSVIENYPGFKKVSGRDLSDKWEDHVKSVGVGIKSARVSKIINQENKFIITAGNDQIESRSVILATGMKRRKLNVPGEKEFKNQGVAYCATCDGPLFKGKNLVVVGGGNAGVEAALFLADIAKEVSLIEIGDKLPAAKSLISQLEKRNNVKIITGNKINEIKGEMTVKSVILDKEVNGQKELACDGVFIEVGSEPDPTLAKSAGVGIDERGFIKVRSDQSTNVPGIFAAGDATCGSNFFWQAITAMAEGAVAADSVNKYLKGKEA